MKPVLAVALVTLMCLSVVMLAAPTKSPVADAAMRGDREAVRTLLQGGADVNSAQNDGMTALHWAAERGDAQIAEMVVYAGANPKAVTRIGAYTPLHIAARSGSAPVVQMLLEKGAEVNAKTSVSGVTALHLAAAAGSVDVVEVLLQHNADANAKESEWGQTPLIFAASQNRVDAIRALLKHGADPGIATKVIDLVADGQVARAASDRETRTLASFQVPKGQEPTPAEVQAAVLSARQVYVSRVIPKEDPSAAAAPGGRGGGRGAASGDDGVLPPISNKGGMTALLHAARQGYSDAVLALIDGGANINQVSPGDKTSPLLIALINGQYDLALQLIKRGANPNLAASVNGVAPLWAAINAEWQPRTRYPQPQEEAVQRATYLDVMTALLDAGADPNARITKHPWYMVYTGCGNQNCGLEDTEGSTAFWRAAYATDVPAMRLLVARGADPNLPTKALAGNGNRSGTPLKDGEAPPARPVQVVAPGLWPATDAATLDPDPSGLPPVVVGGPGVYAIHAASGVGYGEGFAGNSHRHAPDAWLASVRFLVEELGVDVNARDYNGYTALHHAAARGDNEMIMYLVSKGADVKAVARTGQSVADMANGPVQRVSPFPDTVALLEKLGSKNNHRCVTC